MSSIYPVLLVPGIDDTRARFRSMQMRLASRGFDPVCPLEFTPPDGSISIEMMGAQVQAAVRALRQVTHVPKLDIVAYSMGALAVRYFIQRQDGRSSVRRFISLAGPHHGTLAAYLRQNLGCGQMRPHSDLLRELNTDPDPWGEVHAFSFWSPLDLMVLPATSAVLPHAQNRRFGVWFHPWMASDDRVIEAVAQTLAEPG